MKKLLRSPQSTGATYGNIALASGVPIRLEQQSVLVFDLGWIAKKA
jgi:hypothetical protein